MLAEKLYKSLQNLKSRSADSLKDELRSALSGDPGALSLIYAKRIINLEEYNILQNLNSYKKQIRPVDYSDGRPVYQSIYDLLLVYDHRDLRKDYLFRGHSNASWGYTPSEARIKSFLEIESNKSKRNSFLHHLSKSISNLTKDYWELLSIAQHYSFKTMLLDFSYSLQVAAFFATKSQNIESDLGCVIIIGKTDFQSLGIGELKVVDSPINNKRLERQEGCFLARFSPELLGQKGLFEAPCFLNKSNPQIYKKNLLLSEEYLFPEEKNDQIRKIASQYL